MAQQLQEKYRVDDVKIFQSSKLARMTIVIKGDVDVTTKKLKQLHEILSGADVNEENLQEEPAAPETLTAQ